MRTLDEVRNDIDQVDKILVDAIMKRIALTGEVKAIKGESNKEIYDPSREEAIIERLQSGIDAEHHTYLKEMYQLIFDYSRALQRK